MSRPRLNWYGQALEDYQLPTCMYCLADIAHRAHVTDLEIGQTNGFTPPRPTSLFLRDVLAAGGVAAMERRAAEAAEAVKETPAA